MRIAVAANFKPVLEQLVAAYDDDADITLSPGSTGALYAQIQNGAPFDIFFAADKQRPERLDSARFSRKRQTYAFGRLAFWQPMNQATNTSSLTSYRSSIAIANPRHAPYGIAATEVLTHLGIKDLRLINGSNIAQTYTFVHTGNVPAGLVALSQLIMTGEKKETYWIIPDDYHNAIEQQLVILETADKRAEQFVAFLDTTRARSIMIDAGYRLPEPR
ncbi:MAG: molybdate ABC transporter substrate-binding protein [Gammaproteobacteria bacterium]|nr:molybdate ABC transporter substrate-binding protein [Gammaproteobacteria bacterium]MBT4491625.1 molybdate ABC transporter substrate-binding protein [Gammaproteobacteria bacterium]